MRRGTTPTFTLHLKNKDGSVFDTNLIVDLRVTFLQVSSIGKIVVERDLTNCEVEHGSIAVTLTQEETLKFNHKQDVEVQAKLLLPSSQLLSTPIEVIPIGKILNEEVL